MSYVKHCFMDKTLPKILRGRPKITREDNIKLNLYVMGYWDRRITWAQFCVLALLHIRVTLLQHEFQ
jgi:hypothetical protein